MRPIETVPGIARGTAAANFARITHKM
jgi:hypothetical protein